VARQTASKVWRAAARSSARADLSGAAAEPIGDRPEPEQEEAEIDQHQQQQRARDQRGRCDLKAESGAHGHVLVRIPHREPRSLSDRGPRQRLSIDHVHPARAVDARAVAGTGQFDDRSVLDQNGGHVEFGVGSQVDHDVASCLASVRAGGLRCASISRVRASVCSLFRLTRSMRSINRARDNSWTSYYVVRACARALADRQSPADCGGSR
jgi:hypothetical protein